MIHLKQKILGNLLAVAFGVAACFFFLSVAEIVLQFLWKEDPPAEAKYEPGYFYLDDFGITKALPNGHYHSAFQSKKTGQIIFDVVYSIDRYGRRITPVQTLNHPDKFMLFFSDSFVYGEGLKNRETLPYYTGSLVKEYKSYNYAFHGHGPAEMLAKMRSGTIGHEFDEKKGILIYLFIDAHIDRTIGSMRVTTHWGKNRPYFFMDPYGKIQRKGDFTTGRPLVSAFYRLLAKSKLLRLLKVDIPLRITDRHIYFTASVLNEARHEYQRQFPGSSFYTVIYPGMRHGKRLVYFLEKMGIPCLDYSNLFNPDDPRFFLAVENQHPSTLANQTIAEQLVKDLRLN